MGRFSVKKRLLDSEMEVLRCLWTIAPATTRQIFDQVASERKVSQTTINSMVSSMLRKGLLTVVDQRRPQTYVAADGVRPIYDSQLKQVARQVFGPKNLLLRLLSGKHSAAERAAAKKLIDEMD